MGVLFTKHKRIIKIIKGTREGIQKIYVCIIYIISGTKIHHELNELFIADWGPIGVLVFEVRFHEKRNCDAHDSSQLMKQRHGPWLSPDRAPHQVRNSFPASLTAAPVLLWTRPVE